MWLVSQIEIANFRATRALGVDATMTITYFGA